MLHLHRSLGPTLPQIEAIFFDGPPSPLRAGTFRRVDFLAWVVSFPLPAFYTSTRFWSWISVNKSQLNKMATRRNIRYDRIPVDEDDYYDGSSLRQHDPRFDYTPRTYDKVPWKSIFLAIFLLLLGILLLLLAFFIFAGHMGGELSQAYGLLGLGFLTFVPGFYETRIAYYSWRGAQGYRFASIPDY